MFKTIKARISLLILIRFLLQCQANPNCITPFGATGLKMNIADCEPIKWILSRNGTDLSVSERQFLNRSFIDDSTVCCDSTMNASVAFKSPGTEILKHQAESCGDNTVKRISFGTETTFMSHPWSALLIYDTPQRFHCAGTLITNRYILTAALCVSKDYFPLVAVRLREHNITSEVDCLLDDGGFEHCYLTVLDLNIEKVIIHPSYSPKTKEHNIALIRLKHQVEFERSIRPVCLPEYQNQSFDTEYGIITGWGTTAKNVFSDVLLNAVIPSDFLGNCRENNTSTSINDFTICAVKKNEGIHCLTDVGGPLTLPIEGYMNGRKFRYLQAGVISQRREDCFLPSDAPILFTKVSAYMDWIAASIEL